MIKRNMLMTCAGMLLGSILSSFNPSTYSAPDYYSRYGMPQGGSCPYQYEQYQQQGYDSNQGSQYDQNDRQADDYRSNDRYSQQERNWNISKIDVSIKGLTRAICADIGVRGLALEQRLYFRANKISWSCSKGEKKLSAIEGANECSTVEIFSTITCPISLFKMIKISARIIRPSIADEHCLLKNVIPVFMVYLTGFKPKETYQIRIVNKDNLLRAIVTRKSPLSIPSLNPIIPQKLQEEEKHRTSRTLTSRLDQLRSPLEKLEKIMEETSLLSRRVEGKNRRPTPTRPT